MKDSQNVSRLSLSQEWGLIILRIIIGWHFLYEGIVKMTEPGWSAESYLANTRGFMSGIFHSMAADPTVMGVVDFLNIWGLIFIGAGMLLGFCGRIAVYSGILLLFFYYIAYPPFRGLNFGAPQEGRYLLVDKTFIEMMALCILAIFPSTLNTGLWSLISKLRLKVHLPFVNTGNKPMEAVAGVKGLKSRREMLKHLAFIPFLGGFTWAYAGNKKYSADAFSGSTFTLKQESLGKLEGKMPMGVLAKGKPPVSRLILGSNILSGTAHARDLVYTSSLFRAYNTEKKIMETYLLAEQAGINLFYITPVLTKYRKIYGTKIQTWINVDPRKGDINSQIGKAVDQGADYIFIMGAAVDNLVLDGNLDLIAKSIDFIKQQSVPAGLGAHSVEALYACEEAGIDPDFYYKTMHHDQYWSAHPRENRIPLQWRKFSQNHNEFNDNMWCLFPEKTVEFVQKTTKPVIGFKVLAAGAIRPEVGFQWAFDNGADFIDVGMFDFQIVANVNQTIRSFEKARGRTRQWYG